MNNYKQRVSSNFPSVNKPIISLKAEIITHKSAIFKKLSLVSFKEISFLKQYFFNNNFLTPQYSMLVNGISCSIPSNISQLLFIFVISLVSGVHSLYLISVILMSATAERCSTLQF